MARATRVRRPLPRPVRLPVRLAGHGRAVAADAGQADAAQVGEVQVEETRMRDRYLAVHRALRLDQRRLQEALDDLEDEIADADSASGGYWSLLAYELFGVRPAESQERRSALVRRQRALRLVANDHATARAALAAGDLDEAERLAARTSRWLGVQVHR